MDSVQVFECRKCPYLKGKCEEGNCLAWGVVEWELMKTNRIHAPVYGCTIIPSARKDN